MAAWEENIRKVVPYVPGDQPKKEHLIKLNTNENPYPPSPLTDRALKSMDASQLRKYPDPTAAKLVEALADYHGVDRNNVFVGVGSDDVLATAFLTFFNSDKPILFPDVTYSFYPVWADLFKIPYETVAVDEEYHIHPEDFTGINGGIVFPNPNAPTGLLLSSEDVEEIIRCNRDSVVIVDEAYIDFGGVSVLPLIYSYDNLLIVRTFSKSRSMAGMRIGYAIGSEKLIKAMLDVRFSYNSYSMNLPSIVLGVESLKDETYFREILEKITATRQKATERFRELGFICPDSYANFLFVKHKEVPAKEIFNALKEEAIYVRYFDLPRLDDHLRVTIGTDEEMEELFLFLERWLNKR